MSSESSEHDSVCEPAAGCTLAQALDGKPRPPKEAAALLETLAHAIHHCHQRGIIHGDLKPAIVLLSLSAGSEAVAFGSPLYGAVPKITDFGLRGTSGSMAPERVGVATPIGPGADVYGLGAILYEMLTGRPPLQGLDDMQTLIMVQSMDPVPPRLLQPKVPGDLETICLKCLAKSPPKRYPSALALAEDLRRFRDGKPIQARPAGRMQHVFTWAQRKPAAAMFVTVFAGAVIILALAYAELRRANSNLHQVNLELQTANQSLQASIRAIDTSQPITRAAIDRMLVRLADQLPPVPLSEDIRRESLEDARKLYESLTAIRPHDPASSVNLAEAFNHLGKVYRDLGREMDAEAGLQKAHDVYSELVRKSPEEADYLRGLAGVANNLANLEYYRGRLPEAARIAREAVAKIEPLTHKSADAATLSVAADLHNSLALMLRKRPEAEKEHHRIALELRQRRLKLDPDADARADLAASHANLGTLLLVRKHAEEAVEHLHAAVNLLAKPRGPVQRSSFAELLGKLAEAYENLNKPDEAFKVHAAKLTTVEALANDYATVPAYRYLLAKEQVHLASFLRNGQQNEQALKYLQLARPSLEKLVRDFPKNAAYGAELNICRLYVFAVEENIREAKKNK